MDSFVLAGKAKVVFHLLEMLAKAEKTGNKGLKVQGLNVAVLNQAYRSNQGLRT